jgi:hypothetical protein
VVFSSTDGVTWTKAARLGVSVDGGSETLGVWNGALWAVTYPSRARSGIGSSVLWRSRDGRTWRRAGAAPHDAIIDQLVSANGDLIATGVDGNEPGAWTSKDALRWTPMDVSRPAGGRLDRTATNGGSVVAFGTAPELRDFYRWERPRPRSGPRESDERVRRDPDAIPVPQVDVPGVQLDREEWRTQWASTPGSARRRCVPVEDHTEVRSGELIVGNFSSFVSGWDGTYETSKLYYIPLHPDVPAWPDDTKPLHVSAELLDGSLPRRVALDFSGFALSARGVLFYATGTVLPEAGTWRLRATAGRNEGCFLVTV